MRIYLLGMTCLFTSCLIHAQTTLSFSDQQTATPTYQYADTQSIVQKRNKTENRRRTQNTIQTKVDAAEQKQAELERSIENYSRRGIVIAKNRVRINSRIDAAVSKLHFIPGEQFEQNDLLIAFDCSIERAVLEETRLSHEVAKFDYQAHKREAEEVPIAPQTLELSKLKMELALTKLNSLRERIKHCRIFAPFNGRVLKVLVQEYETVDTLTPIMEIVDDQLPHFRTFVPWTWLNQLSIGTLVEIEIMNKRYPAELVELSEEVDPLDQSVKAILRFQSRDGLIIGMNGVVQFKM